MPDDFRDALIVSLYENRESGADCGNYREVLLLAMASKIFVRVILNRLIPAAEQNLPEAQCGFGPARNTAGMMFATRQPHPSPPPPPPPPKKKRTVQNMLLYYVSIDLTKAYDTINRKVLWTVSP